MLFADELVRAQWPYKPRKGNAVAFNNHVYPKWCINRAGASIRRFLIEKCPRQASAINWSNPSWQNGRRRDLLNESD